MSLNLATILRESARAHPGKPVALYDGAVAHAAVVGVPDERLGEEVKAYVSTKPGATVGAQELIDYVKARVAAYKYPRTLEFRDALPLGPTGKVAKREL